MKQLQGLPLVQPLPANRINSKCKSMELGRMVRLFQGPSTKSPRRGAALLSTSTSTQMVGASPQYGKRATRQSSSDSWWQEETLNLVMWFCATLQQSPTSTCPLMDSMGLLRERNLGNLKWATYPSLPMFSLMWPKDGASCRWHSHSTCRRTASYARTKVLARTNPEGMGKALTIEDRIPVATRKIRLHKHFSILTSKTINSTWLRRAKAATSVSLLLLIITFSLCLPVRSILTPIHR